MKNVRYIYYDKFSGQILDIIRKRKRGTAPYIKCDVEEVLPILAGKKGINDLIVAYDNEVKKHLLVEKNNIIKLRNLGSKIYKIPYKRESTFDLRLLVYPKSYVLEITLDPANISYLYNTNFREEVMFEKGTEIRIFIKDKKGEKLFKTIVIEAQKLLDAGQLLYDISELNMKDISFHTYRMFQKCIWYKGKSRFLSPVKDKIKFDIQKADTKRRNKDFSYHLVITYKDGKLKIKNNIEDLKLVKIFEPIDFFIVDKLDPNILHGTFSLTIDSLKKESFLVELNKIQGDKTLLYNHKHISVLFEER